MAQLVKDIETLSETHHGVKSSENGKMVNMKEKKSQTSLDAYLDSEKYREKLVREETGSLWGDEIISHKSYNQRYLSDHLKWMNSDGVQAFMALLVLLDLSLALSDYLLPDGHHAQFGIFLAAGVVVFFLLVDVVLRIMMEGIKYFRSKLSVFEFLIVIVSFAAFIYRARSIDTPLQATTVGRVVRPAVRVMRLMRAMLTAFFTKGGLTGRVDRMADGLSDRLIEKYLGDIFHIPPQNATLEATKGRFRLEKALIRSDAFQKLHCPFTVLGGLIEYVDIDLNISGRSDKEDSGVFVAIHNVLLIIGPDENQTTWEFDDVRERKQNLVDLLMRRLETTAPKPTRKSEPRPSETPSDIQKESNAPQSTRQSQKTLTNKLRKNLNKMMSEALKSRVVLDIHKITLKFEDDTGISGNKVVCCFDLTSFQAHLDNTGEPTNAEWSPSLQRHASAEKLQPMASDSLLLSARLGGVSAFVDVGYRAKPSHKYLRKQGSLHALPKMSVENNWERAKLALFRSLLTDATSHHKRVRIHRLRDKFAAHKYLLLPTSLRLHALLQIPDSNEQQTRKDAPGVDFDIDISPLELVIDKEQVLALRRLAQYSSDWMYRNERLQWLPVCVHTQRILPHHRWQYALRRIQSRISPHYAWATSSRIKILQVSQYRSEYIKELLALRRAKSATEKIVRAKSTIGHAIVKVEKEKKEKKLNAVNRHARRVAELQVFLSYMDIVLVNLFVLQLPLDTNSLHKDKNCGLKGTQAKVVPSNTSSASANKSHVDDSRCAKPKHTHHLPSLKARSTVSDDPGLSQLARIINQPWQLHIHAGSLDVSLCSSVTVNCSQFVRRPLVQGKMRHVEVVVCKSPPNFVRPGLTATEHWPTEPKNFVAKIDMESCVAVNCAAPSTMPYMRILMQFLPPTGREPRSSCNDEPNALSINIAQCESATGTSHVFVAIFASSIGIRICKPLLEALKLDFTGLQDEHKGSLWFESGINIARRNFHEGIGRTWQEQRGFQKLVGGEKSSMQAQIETCGFKLECVEPWTPSLWMHSQCLLPQCVVHVTRSGHLPACQFGLSLACQATALDSQTIFDTEREMASLGLLPHPPQSTDVPQEREPVRNADCCPQIVVGHNFCGTQAVPQERCCERPPPSCRASTGVYGLDCCSSVRPELGAAAVPSWVTPQQFPPSFFCHPAERQQRDPALSDKDFSDGVMDKLADLGMPISSIIRVVSPEDLQMPTPKVVEQLLRPEANAHCSTGDSLGYSEQPTLISDITLEIQPDHRESQNKVLNRRGPQQE